MAAWEYGELMAESVLLADEGDWVTQTALTWHGPSGGRREVSGTIVNGLNHLGSKGWELVGMTRNQIDDRFQIKVVATYVLKRSLRRRPRHGDPDDSPPTAA